MALSVDPRWPRASFPGPVEGQRADVALVGIPTYATSLSATGANAAARSAFAALRSGAATGRAGGFTGRTGGSFSGFGGAGAAGAGSTAGTVTLIKGTTLYVTNADPVAFWSPARSGAV